MTTQAAGCTTQPLTRVIPLQIYRVARVVEAPLDICAAPSERSTNVATTARSAGRMLEGMSGRCCGKEPRHELWPQPPDAIALNRVPIDHHPHVSRTGEPPRTVADDSADRPRRARPSREDQVSRVISPRCRAAGRPGGTSPVPLGDGRKPLLQRDTGSVAEYPLGFGVGVEHR